MNSFIIIFFIIISIGRAQWEPITFPDNEQVNKIISDGNTLFAATVFSRVYQSTDNGLYWTQIGSEIDDISYATDVLHKKGDFLFFSHNIGAGDNNFRCAFSNGGWGEWEPLQYQASSFTKLKSNTELLFTIISGGIAFSDDYGDTWTLMPQPPLEGYLNIPFVDDNYIFVNHGCNLYRTNSMGEIWEDVTGVLDEIGPPEPYSCTSVMAVEMVSDKLIASMYWYGGVGRLFYSDNYGGSWEWIDTFPSQSGSGMGDSNVNALAGVSDYLFAGTATSQDGLFYSNDFENWDEYSGGLGNYAQSFSDLIYTNEFLFKTGGTVNVYRAPIPQEIAMETTWFVSPTGSDASGTGEESNPFGSIQYAINMANEGDTVILLPGIYNEHTISFEGKNINVGSLYHTTADTSYIEGTIIDGSGESCVFYFTGNETRDALLIGLTIQNGLGCVYGQGGGVYIEQSSPTLDHLIIQNNIATTSGGGVLVNIGSDPLLKNLTIRNNIFYMNGGGISISGASAEIENCKIYNNSSMEDYSAGGGISFSGSNGTISGSTISDNIAESGGGIYCSASSPSVEQTIIKSNNADYGGGINCRENSSPALSYLTIKNNIANQGGGLRFRDNSNAFIQYSQIFNNSASYYGGGIYSNNADPNITQCVIAQNNSEFGGAVYGRINSDINIQYTTITDNHASEGGGLYLRNNSTSWIERTIFWNDLPHEIFLHPSEGSTQLSVSYSDVQGGLEGIAINMNGTVNWLEGNIDSDPLFCNPEDGDYSVAANSPCQILISDIGALGVGCDALWEFALYGPELSDVSGNGIWEPGESLSVSVTLCNEGTMDHMYYPGVALSEIYPSPDITINNPEFWWYGMFAGQCESAGFTINASEIIVPGTQVELLAEGTVLNCGNMPEFCINNSSLEFSIQIGVPFGETALEVQYSESWNLIGLPVITEDSGYESIFEGAVSGTLYRFDDGYVSEIELTPGTGYWVRLESEEQVNFTGGPIQEIILHLSEGWNLVSGISSSVTVQNIIDSEGLIIEGTIYQFYGGYSLAETIEPGRAYWVRSSGEGAVIVQN
ncbi:MAG: hypothetical protein CMG69_03670 [Candidatus Marinimicrobia bacterium]|nr:hypothetical protein [Candidatus Neomarinimicrobiota bacterium]